jgi:hypothetical protein
VELTNIGNERLDLRGVHFTNGIQFTFTESVATTHLDPGQRILLVKNAATFATRYGPERAALIAGQYTGQLENNGESVRLDDAHGEKILEFTYDNAWYPLTDGLGFSLVIADESAAIQTWNEKSGWRPSGALHGSPGAIDAPQSPTVVPVVISEILTQSTPPQTDVIELSNPGTNPADVSGWFLTDDPGAPRKFQLPAGTVIPPNGCLVFDETAFNPAPGSTTSFALSSIGDEVWLYSADAAGSLTGYAHGFSFAAAEANVSFAPHQTSQGDLHLVAQRAFTPGQPNAGPKVGPIILTEIHFHPAERNDTPTDPLNAGEFIELSNVSGTPVPLFDPLHPTNTWSLAGSIQFTFPTNVSVVPGAIILVVDFDPATEGEALARFRAAYSVPLEIPVFGPFAGQLENSGGRLSLLKPGLPLPPSASEPGFVPAILVEEVDYADSPPWSFAADGFGPSLQRMRPAQYANDPIHWHAGTPTPGIVSPAGPLPAIQTQPEDQSVYYFSDSASFTVAASGGAPLSYQWWFNGDILPGATQSTLSLPSVQPEHAGHYRVMVFNHAGAVFSQPARLTARFLPIITRQPQSTNVFLGNNATFTVEALGTGPLRYQWLFNDQPLAGRTNPALVLTNVSPALNGHYAVEITDDLGTIRSGNGTLVTLILPQIVQQPQSQTVVQGETARFSVQVTGTSPFGYRWRRGTSTVVPFGQGTSELVLTNVQASDAASYTVVVTNLASIIAVNPGTLSSAALLTVLSDSDGDRLPDLWESAHGLNPASAEDADLDPDSDGHSNRHEYLAGTDPHNAASVLQLQAFVEGTNAAVEWNALSNKSYTVQFKESWTVGKWYSLAHIPARITNRLERAPDPYIMTEGRLYRVVTPQLPAATVFEPIILQSPHSTRSHVTDNLQLRVIAADPSSVRYQWRKDNLELPGATEPWLSLTNLTVADAGDYSVTLADASGSVQTTPARVSVGPRIIIPPRSQAVSVGQTATFQVTAIGESPLRYAWIHKLRPLAGQTNSTLILPNIQPSQAGDYGVVVHHLTPLGDEATFSPSVRLTVTP